MTAANRPIIATASGGVQGIVEDGVAAFRGIPYAASPVTDLRFAAPQPHPKWDSPREASRPGPAVPQNASRLEAVMGARTPDWDEDGSLTLNIWTPQVPGDGTDGKQRAVLLWFHGGGFTSGSSGWDWYDGRNLAAAGDIVVVTANYRLGALGYLYLPELGVANLGVQDQVAALEWVVEYIGAFGGDPGQITVGGQSAGAFSSVYLAVDPATGPLVKRLIVQSCPYGLPPQDPEEAADHARRFVDVLGLAGSGADLLGALRRLPAERFLSAYGQLAQELARPGNVAPPMYSVLGAPGIAAGWEQALSEGRLDGKQLFTGTTKNEMTAFLASDGSPDDARIEAATEAVFRNGTIAVADHHAAAGNGTYVYQFDYSPADDPKHLGAAHCVDLPFFFDTIDAYPDSPMLGEPTDAARALAATFSRAAATFVGAGRPIAEGWHAYASGGAETIRHFDAVALGR